MMVLVVLYLHLQLKLPITSQMLCRLQCTMSLSRMKQQMDVKPQVTYQLVRTYKQDNFVGDRFIALYGDNLTVLVWRGDV